MHDLDLYFRPHDLNQPLRILYENSRGDQVYIVGCFRLSDDSEVDYKSLSLEDREEILMRCKQALQKRKEEL